MRPWFALLFLPALADAADLRLRHQGRLVDTSGAPVGGTQTLTVRLVNSDVGGTNVQVWNDTFSSVPVEGGYYTVELGSGAVFSSGLLSTHPALWLEVAIGSTVLGPRTRLSSVPTAGLAYGVVLPAPGGPTCSVAGMLAYDGTEVKVCDGTAWDDAFDATVTLVTVSGAARWSDGSNARSCEEYRFPTSPKTYSGATGDGLYWIDPSGASPFKVWCDQTTDGGGWTLITSITDNTSVQAVTSTTLVAPTESGSKTNRSMGCRTSERSSSYRTARTPTASRRGTKPTRSRTSPAGR